MFWSRRSKRISKGRTWLKQRSTRSYRSKHISLGRTGSKPRCFGHAGQDVSRLVVLGQNIDFLLAPLEKYLAWSKPKCFGRTGRNVTRLVELGQDIEFCGCADRTISRLVELGRNIDVLVARVETYLAWSNLVKT